MTHMTLREQFGDVQVVRNYNLDTLGAPFKVTLVNGVTITKNASGKEIVEIPDLIGLVGAVIRARSIHPRKLNGKEVKFFRKAIGVKAKSLACFLEMTQEHFSRCEAGVKMLSPSSEKIFRTFAFIATFYENAEDLLAKIEEARPKVVGKLEESEMAVKVLKQFFGLKIQCAFDPDDELHFEFVRRPKERKSPDVIDCENKEWSDEPELISLAVA